MVRGYWIGRLAGRKASDDVVSDYVDCARNDRVVCCYVGCRDRKLVFWGTTMIEVLIGTYLLGAIWVGIGNKTNPLFEPMPMSTKVKLALLWPYHLVNRQAYSDELWKHFDHR